MTATVARLTEPRVIAGLGLLVIAAAVGALAGYDPTLSIAAAVGMTFVLVAVSNLAVGVTVFGFLTFLELVPTAGGGLLSLPKLAGLTLAVSWIAAISLRGGRDRLFGSALLAAAIAFFVAWVALSGLWAEDSGRTWTALSRYALNAALFPIVFIAVREARHLRWVAYGIVAGATLAAGYGLATTPNLSGAATSITSTDDLNRVSGTIGDPNQLASVLVVGVVISFALALDRLRPSPARLITVGSALLCLAVIFATVSRGGIVALATALIASVALGGPRKGGMALLASFAVLVSLAYFAFAASPAQLDRLITTDGGTGRTDIWKIGWRMVDDKPFHGVGAGNFSVSSIHYLLVEPGALERDEFIVTEPKVAHNMYLEVLAETGIVGLVLFLVILAMCIYAFIRAASIFDRADEDGLALITRGFVVGLIAILAADFFLSDEFGKLLWMLLSLGPASLAIARRCATAKGAEGGGQSPAGPLSPGARSS